MNVEAREIQAKIHGAKQALLETPEEARKQETIMRNPVAYGNVEGNNEPAYEQYRTTPLSQLPERIHFGAWRRYEKGEKVYPHHTRLIRGQISVPTRLYGRGKQALDPAIK